MDLLTLSKETFSTTLSSCRRMKQTNDHDVTSGPICQLFPHLLSVCFERFDDLIFQVYLKQW